MRVIKELTLNPAIKATLFSWNGKYLIKLESGLLEQTYKVAETDVAGVADIDHLLASPEFLARAEAIFREMDQNLDGLF